ncbi:MAG: S-layer homology domain-containing protein, partial [Syntrophomonas sp.]
MIERRRGTHAYLLLALFLLGMLFPGGGVQAATSDGEKTAANQFSDVSSSDLNGIYISYLTAREILEGFPDGSFHPQEGLTRAQAAIVICKALNMEIKSGETDSGFKDVAKDYWAAAYIAAAVKAGYLKGFPDGNYKPEEKLSRAQGVSLTLRLSKQSDPGVALPQLRDMDNNHWAARSFAVAIDAGMIQPNSEKKIEPDSPLSRGDLSRALALLLTKDPVLSSCSLNSTLKVNSGDVKLSRKGGQAGEKVSGTAQIGAGDTVETEANGEAVINYPDGSSFLLKNDSKLVIKESQGRAYIKKNGQPGIAVDNLEVE